MAEKSQFNEAIIDDEGNALSDVAVTVKLSGTSNLAQIFSSKSGAGKVNPFNTSLDGIASFWANPGSYDVTFSDTQNPKRVNDRTLTWEAVSGATGGITPSQLEPSSGVVELGYAEITSDATSTSAYPTITKVTGASITVVKGVRPVMVRAWAGRVHNSAANGRTILSILQDNVEKQFAAMDQHATVSEGGPMTVEYRCNAAPGTYVFDLGLSRVTAGTSTILAGAGSTPSAAFIQAIEV